MHDVTDNYVITVLNKNFPQIRWELDEISSFFKTINLMNLAGNFYKEREKKVFELIHFSFHAIKCIRRISRKKDVILLDCGCGRSYLPFFLNFILKKMQRDISYIGIDSNEALIQRTIQVRDKLEFTNMSFFRADIVDFTPDTKVDIVCALHACDTATDEAIAKGIKLDSRFIIVVPCCQRQIVRQLRKATKKILPFKPFLQSKVSKEYIGVSLTETLRKLVMESYGYKDDMFEFISTRFTPKNIMHRAERISGWDGKSLSAYKALRDFFSLKPQIEEYLPWLKKNLE